MVWSITPKAISRRMPTHNHHDNKNSYHNPNQHHHRNRKSHGHDIINITSQLYYRYTVVLPVRTFGSDFQLVMEVIQFFHLWSISINMSINHTSILQRVKTIVVMIVLHQRIQLYVAGGSIALQCANRMPTK
jgi:hypothetical protein